MAAWWLNYFNKQRRIWMEKQMLPLGVMLLSCMDGMEKACAIKWQGAAGGMKK